MNAAERLWRGLEERDWPAVRAQFHATAEIAWPHAGTRMGVVEYVATQRERTSGGRDARAERIVGEGRAVAVEGRIGDARCAAFYDLHDGHIAGAVEYWVGEPA